TGNAYDDPDAERVPTTLRDALDLWQRSEVARRQIRRPAPPPAVRFTGAGLAVAGLSCGGVGLLFSLVGLGLALVVQIT
ncbi:hypothetical protein AB0F83_14130, partial [Micromonospora chalcea]